MTSASKTAEEDLAVEGSDARPEVTLNQFHLMELEQQSVSDAHVAGLGAHGDQACPSPAWYPAQT